MVTEEPMATRIDPSALLRLSQWFSANYPVGGYAYSHGLEWFITEGKVHNGPSFEAWLFDILRYGAPRNDIILLAAAHRGGDCAELSELAMALGAGAERLQESKLQGAAFAQVTGAAAAPYPVAIGAAARAEALPLAETALFYVQNFAANLVTIACRAIPLGASEGQAILKRLSPLIAETAQEGGEATLDDLGGFAPLGDIGSIHHETQDIRIYRT